MCRRDYSDVALTTRCMPTTINHSTCEPVAGPRVTWPRGEDNENLLPDKHAHPLTTIGNVAFARTGSITVDNCHIINLFLSYRTISRQTDSDRHVHVRFAGVDLLDGARRRDDRQLARVARRVPSSVPAAQWAAGRGNGVRGRRDWPTGRLGPVNIYHTPRKPRETWVV